MERKMKIRNSKAKNKGYVTECVVVPADELLSEINSALVVNFCGADAIL